MQHDLRGKHGLMNCFRACTFAQILLQFVMTSHRVHFMRDVVWLVSSFGIPMMHCFLYRLSTLRLAFFLWFILAFHGPELGQFHYCTSGDRAVFFNLSKYIVVASVLI